MAVIRTGKNTDGYPRNDDLYTPPWVFETLNIKFDLDVAAPIEHKDHVPATNRLTVLDDGLAQEWTGKVWCNPPFSSPKPWVSKFINHGNGILLAPIGSNGHWVTELFDSSASVRLLNPTMKFVDQDGNLRPVMWRIALWAMGDECVKALANFGKVR